jgi:CheY-like chemotaxis protein
MQRMSGLLGHEAILCSSASEATKMAADEKPELILVDFSLSDSDGVEVIQNLRQQPITASTPIFVLSAGISSKTAQAAKNAGATGCLEKPLSLDLLSQVIKNYALK